ncbi:MAG: sigma-54-dependent transcriptional regulator [Sulfuricaulis sp.]
MNDRNILVIDDQEPHRDLIRDVLTASGYAVETAASGEEALERMQRGDISLMLTDQLMRGMSGIDLMRRVRAQKPELPVVIVTAHGTVDTAVNAMKAGATDYIQKPFTPEELLIVVRRVLERLDLVEEVQTLRRRIAEPYRFDRIVSQSPKMTEVFEVIRHLVDLDTTVLITGETGTGKELVAHAIHYNSNRRNQRFVRINCGALPETLLESELFGHERGAFSGATHARSGKFEYASGGTLLLDEIGDISPAMQLKLLRVLQEKEIQRVGGNETIRVDVRIMATTNRDLETAIAAKAFRSDLYYRLNVVRIQLPPLRERMEDVPLLAEHFLRVFGEKTGRALQGIDRGAMNALTEYPWPGNVRELANVIERAAVMAGGDRIMAVDLPVGTTPAHPNAAADRLDLDLPFKEGRQQVIAEYEKAYLVNCLRRYKGNIGQCAQHCGVDAKTFYRKMQEYDLDKHVFRRPDEPPAPN